MTNLLPRAPEPAANPYRDLPARRFWSRAVRPVDSPRDLQDIYRARFPIAGLRIATAGSCFAQHIARSLRRNGFSVIDKEPPPRWLTAEDARALGYLQYSARHGNIYTSRLLLQLVREAFGEWHPSDPVWQKGERFHDALRPQVEPDGLASPEEVLLHRRHHLERFRMVLEECDLFIFTFGLTETWMNTDGQVYSSAPGVEAGSYDPSRHVFKNFDYVEILEDFMAFRQIMRQLNPDVKFLVTVSPVPLAATAADRHVLTATIRSKSVLRAVADRLYETCEDVDYFPSYDMLSSPFLGPSLFEADKRDVSAAAVRFVMKTFLAVHLVKESEPPSAATKRSAARRRRAEDPACEEALLDAFAP